MSIIKLTRQRRELEVTPAGLTWAGPTDPEPDAPIVACELPITALDTDAVAQVVARMPVPSTLVCELAARCPPGDDDGNADPRWRRARAAAAIARGNAVADVRDETGTLVGGVAAMRVLANGTAVYVRELDTPRTYELVIGDATRAALPVHANAIYSLPVPLAMTSDQIVVTIYTAARTLLIAFDLDGRELARVEAVVPFVANGVSHGNAGYWLHDDGRHVQLGGGSVERRPYGSCVAGRWLLAIVAGSELAWLSVDTGERRGFAWPYEPSAIVRDDGADVLWCSTAAGLWRLRAGEAPERVRDGEVTGLAVDGADAWIVVAGDVVAIELATGAEHWRTPIAHSVWVLRRFAQCIVAIGFNTVTCLARDGRILARFDERRDAGAAQLADGTVAVSCGEQVAIIDVGGAVRWALPLPYDGQIVGATADRFVFGPVSGGEDHVSPTALVALDRNGRVTSRRVPAARPLAIGARCVWVYGTRGSEVVAWDPHGANATGVVAPPPRMPTERGARRIGSPVTNPRDDRPEVGIAVQADFLALDGTYGGSSGQFSEAALRVGDGAIATFVRCDLTIGGGGRIAERSSTVFLIDCKLPPAEWSIGSACHLAIVGGQVVGSLRVYAPGTATVTVVGLVVRRAGDVHVVTSATSGLPIVVDGVTYVWEKDERSGSLAYAARRKLASHIHVSRDDGWAVSFELPDGELQAPGWWRSLRITDAVIERAIRIADRAKRSPPCVLAPDEVVEAFDGSVRTIEDELAVAGVALDQLVTSDTDEPRAAFIRGMLAVGCCASEADRTAIDDWCASRADLLSTARPALQRVLEQVRTGEWGYSNRSAIAFLIDMCARVHVELGLATEPTDLDLRGRFRRSGPRPWGIPASHWWWDQPPEPAESELDPHF